MAVTNEELWKHFIDMDQIRYCSIADFKGMTIGINATNWLDKALCNSLDDLIENNFKDFMFYVDQLLLKVRNFRNAGVEPVMVFEGNRNLLKTEAQIKKEEGRQLMLDQGQRLVENFKTTNDPACKQKLRQEAISSLQKGLKSSPEMVSNVIAALKQVGVTVIVAPCEVDAQLVQLCVSGICQAVLSENFDLMLYNIISGCSFPLIFKFETTGHIHVVSLKSLGLTSSQSHSKILVELPPAPTLKRQISIQSTQSLQSLNLSSILQEHFHEVYGARLFLQLCLLMGCEFVETLRDIVPSKALEIILRFREVPCNSRLIQVVRHIQSEGYQVPHGYLERLLRAETLYYYHPVYDPIAKTIKPLLEPNILFSSSFSSSTSSSTSSTSLSSSSSASYSTQLKPVIDQHEMRTLAVGETILEKAPEQVSLSDICEGHISAYSYNPIVPRLPWDHPDLRPPPHMVHSKEIRLRHGVWGTRFSLMKCLSPSLSSSSDSQSSEESPLSQSPFSTTFSQVPLMDIFGVSSLRAPRRPQQKTLRESFQSPLRLKETSRVSEDSEDEVSVVDPPNSPPDIQKISPIDADFHSPSHDTYTPTSSASTAYASASSSSSSSSSSLSRSTQIGSSSIDTISPPLNRSSSAHQCGDDIKVLSPDPDRLGNILEEEVVTSFDEKRRLSRDMSLDSSLSKRRRKSSQEDVVAISLNKGKNQKKTMYVASIQSYFR